MNRLDALTVRESNGKSYWTRVGVAFQSKDGDGWNVLLDAMPAPYRRPVQDHAAPAKAGQPTG